MRLLHLLTAGAALGLASAQDMSLSELLQSTSDLSDLRQLLMSNSALSDSLMNATNITVLAPSNNAISQLRRSGLLGVASQEQITALLEYHVLQGKIYGSDITSSPQFCSTMLNDTMYANVTGGQVVEAEAMNGTVTFFSGLKLESNVTQAVSISLATDVYLLKRDLECELHRRRCSYH
jgi:uncharacterized surface protein with fasciclin (FAS1) repeats